MKQLLKIGFVLTAFAAGPSVYGQDVSLTAEIQLTTAIEDRQPVDKVSSVSADTGQLILWCTITGATEPTTITHVWALDGEEMAAIPLNVTSTPYRTWSRKSLWGRTGNWTVKVKDSNSNVLASTNFTVTPEKTGAPVEKTKTKEPAAPAAKTSPPKVTIPTEKMASQKSKEELESIEKELKGVKEKLKDKTLSKDAKAALKLERKNLKKKKKMVEKMLKEEKK